jgi:hypothetical protein
MKDAFAWFWAYEVKHRAARWREYATRWIAWHMPRYLVMWCAVRLGAEATTGRHSDTVVPELSFMDALKRWSDR